MRYQKGRPDRIHPNYIQLTSLLLDVLSDSQSANLTNHRLTLPLALAVNLESYEVVRQWLSEVGRHSRIMYTRWMEKFCEYAGKNPDGLLEDANKDRRKLHMQIKNYYLKLQSERYASQTRNQAYTAIRSFFAHNDCFLGRMPKHFRGVTQFAAHRIMGQHEVFAMLMTASTVRDKAIISFLAQTGQRVGVLTALRYRHVRTELEKGITPIVVEVKGELTNGKGWNVNKNGVPYHFAIGSECMAFLRQMIERRKESGEPITDESWLFRSFGRGRVHQDGKWIPLGMARNGEVGRSLEVESVRYQVVRIAKDAGVQGRQEFTPTTRTRFVLYDIHPHAFRRYWKSRMRLAGITDYLLLEYIMGHTTRALPYRGSYDQFDAEYVRRQYAKAEPFLSVMPMTKSESGLKSPTQRVVAETELGGLLAQGWRFVTTLPSGRIILELLAAEHSLNA